VAGLPRVAGVVLGSQFGKFGERLDLYQRERGDIEGTLSKFPGTRWGGLQTFAKTFIIGIALIPLFVTIWLIIDAIIDFGGSSKGDWDCATVNGLKPGALNAALTGPALAVCAKGAALSPIGHPSPFMDQQVSDAA
jgi:hypothetical protein